MSDLHEILEDVLGKKAVVLVEERILELLEARMRANCTIKLGSASVRDCVVFLCQ